jgi:lipopolysaccharide transport system permease protein
MITPLDICVAHMLMDPHKSQPTSLTALARSLWHNRSLIAQMTKRDVIGRYKGSVMGLTWSFFNPLFMLSVYTFVFGGVFKGRWSSVGTEESKVNFAIVLFVGMIVHGLFTECVNRAPGLILGNVNYVKKVIFPLEILPVIAMGSALFHMVVSLVVLLGAIVLLGSSISWTILFFPIAIIPLLLVTMGAAWFLAALGVYVRDVAQITGMITTVLMFLSPVFYPVSAVPERYRPWIMANPLTFIIDQSREVLIWGRLPNWGGLALYLLAALGAAWIGFAWFQKTRKGFADVL